MSNIYRKVIKTTYHHSKLARYYWLRYKWAKLRKAMNICDVEFAKMRYKEKMGKELNLENPVTFSEKLWYLKLSNRDPLMTKCSDKYLAREYVRECGLAHILIELYAVYDSVAEIDFDKVPTPCFFKCNHTSGYNAIYDRSKQFDIRDFKRKFKFMLTQNYYINSREWNYKNIKPRIICERVLEDPSSKVGIIDYRFFCFNGSAKFMTVNIGTSAKDGTHSKAALRNLYDLDFNLLDVRINRQPFPPELVPKPNNLAEMCTYAETLSKPFPHCRVDFYNIDGTIYFGEMTFYSGGGFNKIEPKEWDIKMGQWIDISGYSIAPDALVACPSVTRLRSDNL